MPLGVNLLPQRQSWYLRRRRLARWLNWLALGAGGAYAIAMVGIFSWRLTLNQSLERVKADTNQIKEQLTGLAAVESQQVILKSKLSRLVQLDNTKVEFATLLDNLVAVLPAEVDLTEVKVQGAQSFEVSGRTVSPIALSEVLDAVESQSVELFASATLESLAKASSGEYSFTLKLTPQVKGERK